MDLFKLKVEEAKLHRNYKTILSDSFAPVRQVLNDWASTFVNRDNNFEKEFQTKFNQQFWELYLNGVFRESGFQPEFTYAAPDFIIHIADAEILCEATTTQAAQGIAPEWERELAEFQPGDNDRIFQYATIRFSNAFSSKLVKYRQSYAHLPHVKGKPFILAVGQYEQSLFFMVGHVPALRLLFGLDEPLYTYGVDGEPILLGPAWRDLEIKNGDVEIPMGVFRDDKFKEISGVLCSALATTGKCFAISSILDPDRLFFAVRFDASGNNVPVAGFRPDYEESLTDGLHLFLNPFAEHPIDPQPFIDAGIAVHLYHKDEHVYEFVAPQGTLSTRYTMRIDPDFSRSAIQPSVTLPRPWVTEMPNDRLLWQPVGTLLCDEEYIAHYKGWTIHLAKDRQDQDWFGQAVQKLATSVHGVIEANRYEINSVGPLSSEPTKESAWRKVADMIDGFKPE